MEVSVMETTPSPPAAPEQQDVTVPPITQLNVVGIQAGYALGGIAWLACFFVATRIVSDTRVEPPSTIWLNILSCLLGSIIGWWVGILMSPDPTERGQFLGFRKALSAFLSGF